MRRDRRDQFIGNPRSPSARTGLRPLGQLFSGMDSAPSPATEVGISPTKAVRPSPECPSRPLPSLRRPKVALHSVCLKIRVVHTHHQFAEPWVRSRIKSACGMARHISEGCGKRKRGAPHIPASARRRAVVILSHPPIKARPEDQPGRAAQIPIAFKAATVFDLFRVRLAASECSSPHAPAGIRPC